jgi:hypothetical protein
MLCLDLILKTEGGFLDTSAVSAVVELAERKESWRRFDVG